VTSAGRADAGSAGRVEPLLIGTTVCGGAIAAGAGHTTRLTELIIAILGSVLVYWAAHLHAATLALRVETGLGVLAALMRAVEHTWRIPAASVVPVAVLGCAGVLGIGIPTAAWLAVGATAAMLVGYGYLAGRQAGLGAGGRVASALGGLAVGLLIVLLKASLH
jgi:hypothetical protein